MSLRHYGFLAKIAATVALLWLSFRSVNLEDAVAHLAATKPLFFAGAVLFMMATLYLGALRWHGLLAAHDGGVSVAKAFRWTLIGQALNSALPSTLGGDAARVVYVVRDGGRLAVGSVSVILDRLSGLACCALATAAVALLAPFGLELPGPWRITALILASLVPAGLVALLAWNLVARSNLLAAILPYREFGADLQSVRIRLWAVGKSGLWSLGIIGCIGGALAMLAHGLPAPQMSTAQAVAIAGLTVLATSLPISIAGWGVREVVFVELYSALHLPPEAGLAISILFGLALLLSGLPGFVVLTGWRRSTAG
jgi:uncharacterized membrane protein YbhN (UPF0104 family)